MSEAAAGNPRVRALVYVASFILEESESAESQRFMGERAAARGVEVDASHAVTVSQPGAVARTIEKAACTTR